MRTIFLIGAAFLAGCTTNSQVMQEYVGRPIQDVIVRKGPPTNVFDMPDGRRAFQWSQSQATIEPTTLTSSGTVNSWGYPNSASWTQDTQISGGNTLTSTCLFTMYGRWDDASGAWQVVAFEPPSWDCEAPRLR